MGEWPRFSIRGGGVSRESCPCCRTVTHAHKYETPQASTLTRNDTGPVGPVTPSICWSLIFSLT